MVSSTFLILCSKERSLEWSQSTLSMGGVSTERVEQW